MTQNIGKGMGLMRWEKGRRPNLVINTGLLVKILTLLHCAGSSHSNTRLVGWRDCLCHQRAGSSGWYHKIKPLPNMDLARRLVSNIIEHMHLLRVMVRFEGRGEGRG